ncbi:MAG: hypothetical protein ACOX66_07605 [Oscillospiraceae bacterium]|jgi:hypothetical protein
MSGRFDALWRFGRTLTTIDEVSPAGRTFRGFLEPMDRRASTEKIRTKVGFVPKEKFRLFAEPGETFPAGEGTKLVCGREVFRLLRAKAMYDGETLTHRECVLLKTGEVETGA